MGLHLNPNPTRSLAVLDVSPFFTRPLSRLWLLRCSILFQSFTMPAFWMPNLFSPSITRRLRLRTLVGASHFPSFPFLFLPFSSSSVVPQPSQDTSISEFLFKECGFGLSKVNEIIKVKKALLRIKSTQTARKAVEFMRDRGFTQHHLHKTIRGNPNVIALKVDGQLKPKFEFFKTLGFTDQDLPNFISKYPRLLSSSLQNKLSPRIQYLVKLFGSKENLLKALKRSPELLSSITEKNLEDRLNLFKQSGIQGELLSSLISTRPNILTRSSAELLKTRIIYVRNMGILEGSKAFVYVLCVVCSIAPENWEKKVKHLTSLGLAEDKIVELVKKDPCLFTLSMDKMHENMNFLVGTGGLAPQIVWKNPVLLHFSVEKRVKPRHAVFKALCSMEQYRHGLPSLLMLSEKDFLVKFVERHPQGSILKEIYNKAKNAEVTTC